jgi:hypothetical protein
MAVHPTEILVERVTGEGEKDEGLADWTTRQP